MPLPGGGNSKSLGIRRKLRRQYEYRLTSPLVFGTSTPEALRKEYGSSDSQKG